MPYSDRRVKEEGYIAGQIDLMSSGPETASVSEKQLESILRRVRIWLLHTPCRDVPLPILIRKLDYKLSVRHDFVSFVSPYLKKQFYIVSTASAALYSAGSADSL